MTSYRITVRNADGQTVGAPSIVSRRRQAEAIVRQEVRYWRDRGGHVEVRLETRFMDRRITVPLLDTLRETEAETPAQTMTKAGVPPML